MAWTKTPNVAQYDDNWTGFLFKVSNCSPESAKRIAILNPVVTFFFFCRDGVNLDKQGVFLPGDAVFFSGEPQFGSATECDSYVKNGMTIAYVSPSNSFSLKDVANYTMSDGSPAIDVVCFSGGNFTTLYQKPYLRQQNFNPPSTDNPFNSNVQQALDDGSVPYLQAKGITVLFTIVNGHKPVGWSEFTTMQDAYKFAEYVKTDIVDKYGFDGIDIDDEYSTGQPQNESLTMVTTFMKMLMPEKMVTKPVWQDINIFSTPWNGQYFAQNLDYGWYMGYGANPKDILPDYNSKQNLKPAARMAPMSLSMGYWTGNQPDDKELQTQINWLKTNGYGGFMIFAFEEQGNRELMGTLVDYWYGPGNWNH